MTQEDATVTLDELRALEAAATPGPWTAEQWGPDATILRPDGSRMIVGDALYHPESIATARFIVAAVQYVRDALSVEGREAYNDRAGSSSESNSITDPARPVARPNSGGSVDSRRV